MDRPSPLMIVVLVLAAGALLVFCGGCATIERAGGASKKALVSCGKEYAPAIASTLAQWGVASAIAGKVNWPELEASALELAEYAGVCAYAEFWRAWNAKPAPTSRSLLAAEVDPRAGLERLRAKAGGAQLELSDGTVL